MSKRKDSRIDAIITAAAPFARPLLRHLRALVHRACPEVEETIKWGHPSFVYRGGILCGMAAFKTHCTFGFWHQGMREVLGRDGGREATAMGSFGRITRLEDLPKDEALLGYIKKAARLNESGTPARPRPVPKPKSASVPPPDLVVALKANAAAAATFEKLSPSQRREYIEWIVEAKRETTRFKRLATTLEWLAAGKSRNWQYAKR